MDRSIKIILFLICCISATDFQAQKKSKGNKGFPIYHVKGLEFIQDSTVLNLYYGAKNVETKFETVDSIPIISIESDIVVDENFIDSLNTQDKIADPDYSSTEIDDSDLDPSFENSESRIDTSESDQKLVTLEDIDIFENDSLVYFDGNGNVLTDSMTTRKTIISGNLSQPSDNLEYTEDWDLEQDLDEGTSIPDSLSFEESGELEQISVDSISMANIGIEEDLMPDSLNSNQTEEVITVGSSEILIKSTDSFGKLEKLKSPIFDPSVRTSSVILDPEKPIVTAQTESSVPAPKDMQTAPVVISSSNEKYDGLSADEKNKQIILDAENDRDMKQREMTLRERQLELELARRGISQSSSTKDDAKSNEGNSSTSSYERDKQIRMDAENQRDLAQREMALREKELALSIRKEQSSTGTKTELPKNTSEQPAYNPGSVVPKPVTREPMDAKQIIERTNTKVIEGEVVAQDPLKDQQIKDLIGKLDSKINTVLAKEEEERNIQTRKTDVRIGVIESKIDTLINALGQQQLLDKGKYANVGDEINVYFAVNSHQVTFNQKEQLKTFIDKISAGQDFKIVLSGFADRSGDAAYNKMLVDKRINAVKKTILAMGVAPKEVLLNNYGDEKASTSSLYSKQDRKVTIQLLTN